MKAKFIVMVLFCLGFICASQAQSVKRANPGTESQVKLEQPGGVKVSSVYYQIKGTVEALQQDGITVRCSLDCVDDVARKEKARKDYIMGKGFNRPEKSESSKTVVVFIRGDPSQFSENQSVSFYCKKAGVTNVYVVGEGGKTIWAFEIVK